MMQVKLFYHQLYWNILDLVENSNVKFVVTYKHGITWGKYGIPGGTF